MYNVSAMDIFMFCIGTLGLLGLLVACLKDEITRIINGECYFEDEDEES